MNNGALSKFKRSDESPEKVVTELRLKEKAELVEQREEGRTL